MKKKYYILIVIMIGFSLLLPKIISTTIVLSEKANITISKVNHSKKELKEDFDNITTTKIFQKYAKEFLRGIF